jgi:hypothetical protein
MTIFTTTITAMHTLPEVDGKTNVVVNVFWVVTGVDGGYTAFIENNSQFTLNQDVNFIPYADLQPFQVIGWIPESQIANAQACVQGQIDSMITPPVSPANTPLPWNA